VSELIEEMKLPSGAVLSLRRGDLTEERVDAIVNAANQHLAHGGGVAGAIVRRGGPSIQRESDAVGFTPTGTAAVTGAGDLPARFVIHAVGPVWSQHEEAEADRLLASAVEAALELASARGAESIAFPAISSGIYGFPKDRCARVMLAAVLGFLEENAGAPPGDVRFVLVDRPTEDAFRAAWSERFNAMSNGAEAGQNGP